MYDFHQVYVLAIRRHQRHATPQNTLAAFNQLPEIEKHAIPSEIIKQVTLPDFPPLRDEVLTEIADALFVEHDKIEVEDAEAKSRGSLVR